MSNNKIEIVLTAGHSLLREGLRLLLSSEECFDIVGESNNRTQTIDVVYDLQPDVVLLDFMMFPMNPIEIIPLITQKSPTTKVLMLISNKYEEQIVNGIQSGAMGYLSENSDSRILVKAIKSIHAGDLWIERKMIGKIINGKTFSNVNKAHAPISNRNDLTTREQEVLNVLSKGYSNREIASELYISEKTVKSHLNRIFKKLGVECRLEAILYALKNGLT